MGCGSSRVALDPTVPLAHNGAARWGVEPFPNYIVDLGHKGICTGGAGAGQAAGDLETLAAMVEVAGAKLKYLNLNHNAHLGRSRDHFRQLTDTLQRKCCPNLQALGLCNAGLDDTTSGDLVTALEHGCPTLTQLALSRNDRLGDRAAIRLATFASDHHNLTELDLFGCTSVSEVGRGALLHTAKERSGSLLVVLPEGTLGANKKPKLAEEGAKGSRSAQAMKMLAR